MKGYKSFSLNGRATSASAFVKVKTAHALSASNFWSVTENNSNNSWNVNFNNGNTNNNNKNNSNRGRAVSALGEEELVPWIEAADDCCRNKKTSRQCTEYRIREEVLVDLAIAVKTRTYSPQTSDCFVVKYPKLREIFAAHFVDRIVQHWIILRLEPLLEKLFVSTGDVSFNCRKGYGTLRAVKTLYTQTERITEGWTKDAWIGKFDLRSFFMSIDKRLLWSMLCRFIEQNYHEPDKEDLLWLSEKTVMHRPQDNCIRKGDLSLWDKLPKHKSLFYMDGTAIGNITSQILANFLLSPFDAWAYQFCTSRGGWYERFVDDIPVVLPNKSDVLLFHQEARRFLEERIHLSLHPDKVYIQHASKGVKFVGSVIMPGRMYLSNRTVGKMHEMLSDMERCCKRVARKKRPSLQDAEELEHWVCSCNSYMGFLVHHASYGLRRRMFGRMKWFWRIAFVCGEYGKVVLRNRYRVETVLSRDECKIKTLKIKDYGKQIFKRNAC